MKKYTIFPLLVYIFCIQIYPTKGSTKDRSEWFSRYHTYFNKGELQAFIETTTQKIEELELIESLIKELRATILSPSALRDARDNFMEEYDKNKDKQISLQEFNAILNDSQYSPFVTQWDIKRIIKKADKSEHGEYNVTLNESDLLDGVEYLLIMWYNYLNEEIDLFIDMKYEPLVTLNQNNYLIAEALMDKIGKYFLESRLIKEQSNKLFILFDRRRQEVLQLQQLESLINYESKKYLFLSHDSTQFLTFHNLLDNYITEEELEDILFTLYTEIYQFYVDNLAAIRRSLIYDYKAEQDFEPIDSSYKISINGEDLAELMKKYGDTMGKKEFLDIYNHLDLSKLVPDLMIPDLEEEIFNECDENEDEVLEEYEFILCVLEIINNHKKTHKYFEEKEDSI